MRVLVVEDDSSSQEILSRRLKRKGIDVIQAMDGAEAVRLAIEERPDIVLMDLNMPVLDGWEAIEKIKSSPVGGVIPIIVVTAYSSEEELARAKALRCREYLIKPVDFRVLVAKMEEIYREKQVT